MEGLNRLRVYQEAQELAKFIYRKVLTSLPPEEKWGLSSQIRRAAASIPANIAEGYGRFYYQETIRFCYLARGSLMELSSHIELAADQSYLTNEIKTTLLEQKMSTLLKLIHGYIKYLKQNKQGQNEPGSHAISDYSSDYYPSFTEGDVQE